MNQYRFSKEMRIKSKLDFARIYDQRNRASDEHLLIFGTRNQFDHSRIGLSVSKKHGNAVRRARLKRLLREAFRLKQHELPKGLDLILIPRQNSGAELNDFQKSLARLAKKLDRRLPTENE